MAVRYVMVGNADVVNELVDFEDPGERVWRSRFR
jgi:hypothetical protein